MSINHLRALIQYNLGIFFSSEDINKIINLELYKVYFRSLLRTAIASFPCPAKPGHTLYAFA